MAISILTFTTLNALLVHFQFQWKKPSPSLKNVVETLNAVGKEILSIHFCGERPDKESHHGPRPLVMADQAGMWNVLQLLWTISMLLFIHKEVP
jgi:hypothetical protein